MSNSGVRQLLKRKGLGYLAIALTVDEILGIVAFTSYVLFALPTPGGLFLQSAIWAASYPLALLTNWLEPLVSLFVGGDQALTLHGAFFVAVGMFSIVILLIQRVNKMITTGTVTAPTMFSIGMLMTIVGAFADAYYHLTGLAAQEGFLTPAHGTIYSGATIMLVSTLFLSIDKRAQRTLQLGGLVVVGGGVWDFSWHSVHGFVDVVAGTPPHLTVTAGFLILLVTGFFSLSQYRFPRWVFRATLAMFVVLWTFVILLYLV